VFTGIIEAIGTIIRIEKSGTNFHFWVTSPFTNELKIDQSLAHNGVCLTIVEINGNEYKVTAVQETLNVTSLKELAVGSLVNLERCMPVNGRFDGHIVQGHVDATAVCKHIQNENGSWLFTFESSHPDFQKYVVMKGSITVNGISLTVADLSDDSFSVAIIPYTFEHTNLKEINIGNHVNIEFDIIGKYIAKQLAQR
jgi:riboflavin synthase